MLDQKPDVVLPDARRELGASAPVDLACIVDQEVTSASTVNPSAIMLGMMTAAPNTTVRIPQGPIDLPRKLIMAEFLDATTAG